jgi:hypothetical protein
LAATSEANATTYILNLTGTVTNAT